MFTNFVVYLQNMCDTMFNWTPDQARQFRVRTDIITGEYQINCYIHNLDTFLKVTYFLLYISFFILNTANRVLTATLRP